jgi:hypothetical protein
MHSQCDDIPWTHEALTGKVRGWDGFMYEPLWIHLRTTGERSIRNGDIVKVYNYYLISLSGIYIPNLSFYCMILESAKPVKAMNKSIKNILTTFAQLSLSKSFIFGLFLSAVPSSILTGIEIVQHILYFSIFPYSFPLITALIYIAWGMVCLLTAAIATTFNTKLAAGLFTGLILGIVILIPTVIWY